MSSISEEYLGAVIRKIAAVNHILHWSYDQVKFENIAQNYFGVLIPIVLSGKRRGKDVKYSLVLKLAPTNEQYRVSGAVTVMFVREVYMYSVVLRKYGEIQEGLPKTSQYIIPRCYFVHEEYCKEAIALQDMCAAGYKPYTHEMFLDLSHTLLSLKSLAKLHAFSFILKNKNQELYEEIAQTCIPLTEHTNLRYMEIMRDRLDQALKTFDRTLYIPLLFKLRLNCAEFFYAAGHSVQNSCLCHGDIWKENILFKYEGNKVVSACIIDYQTARISSPAYDVMYLIISSTNTKLRNKYLHQLLDIYFRTFEMILKELGLESKEIYSRQMFDKDLKVVSPACVIAANTALWLSNGLQEVGHVRSKNVLNTKEEKAMALDTYKGIVKAIMDDLSRFGYLSLADDNP
ncbi:hypothetical protein PYW07_009026 [Mythimna separata]|uniref:CHK kinase-like domain-containing protein n=1 Tax=Mythimna separata TaxID=271217 RepID=A0AAD7YBE9_MYTSE|nr:hypothetical protein PYW07_009026 [Mythimna separata]